MRQKLSKESGYTLPEIMTVLMIMSILMGLGAYALVPYFRSQALTGATNEILVDFRDAQVRAQGEVRTYRLIFDISGNSYVIERLESSGNYTLVSERTLPPRVALSEADFGTDGATAYLYPRGTSSSGRVVIIHTQLNQDREIKLEGLTSKAKVV